MAENENKSTMKDYIKIHKDTTYFLDAIVSDYPVYNNFIQAVKDGSAEFEIKRRKLKRTVDEQWIKVIEDSLIALDNAIRKPSKYIEEREEVLPIEMSHNITSRSLRHLSQHTDYIKKIEGDVITPSKILNVFHEETMMTYENKFVNTLIERLYIFVNRRYMKMKEEGESADSIAMDFTSDFKFSDSHGKINLSIEVSDKNDSDNGTVSTSDRLERINSIVTQYYNSDFCKQMGKSFIRPPIMRTNAILKNKDLYQCLLLWQFIESYDKVGYNIDIEESAEKPDEAYITELYSTLALQYMMFRFNVAENIEKGTTVIDNEIEQIQKEPVFKTELSDIEAEDYNVYDTEYRKIVPVSSLSNRKLSESEIQIRTAIDNALSIDKEIESIRKAEEKEKQRLEAKRIAEQKRLEEKQLAERKRQKERLNRMQMRKLEKKKLALEKQRRRKAKQGKGNAK